MTTVEVLEQSKAFIKQYGMNAGQYIRSDPDGTPRAGCIVGAVQRTADTNKVKVAALRALDAVAPYGARYSAGLQPGAPGHEAERYAIAVRIKYREQSGKHFVSFEATDDAYQAPELVEPSVALFDAAIEKELAYA